MSTAAPAAETITIIPGKRPYLLSLTGPVSTTLAEATCFIRQGYQITAESAVEVFPHSGSISLVLTLGDPESYFVERAKQTLADAIAMEQVERAREIKAEAKRIVEAEKRAEAEREVAATIAKHEQDLADLKRKLGK